MTSSSLCQARFPVKEDDISELNSSHELKLGVFLSSVIAMASKKSIEKSHEDIDKELEKTIRLQQKLLDEVEEFKEQFSERLLKLVTSGFGLVSALAWNELIKETIQVYIRPFFGKESGLISLLIYAILVTLLAVFITYQLSKLSKKPAS